jgi:hypothetical protein
MKKIEFHGYDVSPCGIEMDEKKVKAIQEWPTPKSITKVKSFHGLTNFYRCFIKDFSILVVPSTKIMKKSFGFKLRSEHENAFNLLK